MAKILCVDDLPDNLKLLQADLEDEGYEVVTAADGSEALAVLEKMKVSAVILDWMMPGLSGIETLKRIRQKTSGAELPVIMATALNEVENVVEALAAGANDYVSKPIEMEILLARLGAHLRVQELTAERDALARLKDDFLAIVSHDLKNPIGAILGFTKLLPQIAGDALNEQALDMIARIQRNGETMLRMVQDYLDLEALQGGSIMIKLEILDLQKIAEQAIAAHKPTAEKKQIGLELVSSEVLLVQADSDRLRQVVDNLVTNAIKFSDAGTKVTVQVAASNGEVELSVRDQGPGLSDSDRARLFSKFGRLSAHPTAGEKSSGVGLYAARLLIENMSGKISARNNPDRGATFWFRLPVVVRKK